MWPIILLAGGGLAGTVFGAESPVARNLLPPMIADDFIGTPVEILKTKRPSAQPLTVGLDSDKDLTNQFANLPMTEKLDHDIFNEVLFNISGGKVSRVAVVATRLANPGATAQELSANCIERWGGGFTTYGYLENNTSRKQAVIEWMTPDIRRLLIIEESPFGVSATISVASRHHSVKSRAALSAKEKSEVFRKFGLGRILRNFGGKP